MKRFFSITFKDLDLHSIEFGIPEEIEVVDMFRMRYNVYTRHNYIEKDDNLKGMDIDEYDNLPTTYYVIAKIDDQIVGSVRLINQFPPPTITDCFDFSEPEILQHYSKSACAEISRLIAQYPSGTKYPKHIIMFGLFKSLIILAREKKIDFSYSFIKKNLFNDLKRVNFKIHPIKPFKLKYTKNYLHGYFFDKKNGAVPIYLIRDEVEVSIKKINKFMELFGAVVNV